LCIPRRQRQANVMQPWQGLGGRVLAGRKWLQPRLRLVQVEVLMRVRMSVMVVVMVVVVMLAVLGRVRVRR
jgi:hypothetical protein